MRRPIELVAARSAQRHRRRFMRRELLIRLGPLPPSRCARSHRSTCSTERHRPHYGPITIAIRARFEHDTTSYEELCAFEQ